jgi:O-methyltransferase involved in polyketide biosynthesis
VTVDPTDAGEGEYRLTGPEGYSEGWLTDLKIPNDRPVLIIMEGLSMYLSEAENLANFKQFTQHFQHGGEIVFDVLGSFPTFVVNSVLPLFGKMTYNHGWHLNDAKVLEKKTNGVLKVQQYIPWAQYPATDRLPWMMRWWFRAFAFVRASGYFTAILRCKF